MGKKWVKKDKSKPLNILEKEKLLMEDWKIREAFWARRRIQTAQPRTKTQ